MYIYGNSQITNFMNICPVGAKLFHVDGQTHRQSDMTKLRVAFSNFAHITKK
jgi:hypothetical protein